MGHADYEVSNKGRIRSWNGSTQAGRKKRSKPLLLKERIIKPSNSKNLPYVVYVLNSGLGREHIYASHAVLEAFVGPRPEGMVACHGPGGSLDNRLENLEWGTQKKNSGEDKLRDGTDARGDKSYNALLSNEDAEQLIK